MIAKILPAIKDSAIAPVLIAYADYEGCNREMMRRSLSQATKSLDEMFSNSGEFAIRSAAIWANTTSGFEAVLTVDRET